MIARVKTWFASLYSMRAQQQEIKRLNVELAELRAQNTSMRDGMRRCVTCEYRIEFKKHQGRPPEKEEL